MLEGINLFKKSIFCMFILLYFLAQDLSSVIKTVPSFIPLNIESEKLKQLRDMQLQSDICVIETMAIVYAYA